MHQHVPRKSMSGREKLDEMREFLSCSRRPEAHRALGLLDAVVTGRERGAKAALSALATLLAPVAAQDRAVRAAVLLLEELTRVQQGAPQAECRNPELAADQPDRQGGRALPAYGEAK